MSLACIRIVLALADFREDFRVCGIFHGEQLTDSWIMWAHERVGAPFEADGCRERSLAAFTLGFDVLETRGKLGVLRVDGDGELGVGERVFVSAIDDRVIGQGHEFGERRPHLRGRAFQKAAAAERE
jgi:hypothetical protein